MTKKQLKVIKQYSPWIAGVSLLLNAVLIGGAFYVWNSDWSYGLHRMLVIRMCSEPGYSQMLHQVGQSNYDNPERMKKFIAASICFADYNTGKSLDLDSVKADESSPVMLPARR